MNSNAGLVQVEFIRRCHICMATSFRKNQRVECCDHCGKNFVPYFFCHENTLEHSFIQGNKDYPPIYGISLSWS